jgi:hypothetical protein
LHSYGWLSIDEYWPSIKVLLDLVVLNLILEITRYSLRHTYGKEDGILMYMRRIYVPKEDGILMYRRRVYVPNVQELKAMR